MFLGGGGGDIPWPYHLSIVWLEGLHFRSPVRNTVLATVPGRGETNARYTVVQYSAFKAYNLKFSCNTAIN